MITIKPEHFYIFCNNVIENLEGKDHKILFSNNTNHIKKRMYNGFYRAYCEQAYIGFNNSHFKPKEFGIYLLHSAIFNVDILKTPKEWDLGEITKTNLLYTPKILKKDSEIIEEVSNKISLTDKSKLGIIQSSGESILYTWMKNKIIHPITLVKMKRVLCSEGESQEHKNMRKLVDMIELLYAQKTIE